MSLIRYQHKPLHRAEHISVFPFSCRSVSPRLSNFQFPKSGTKSDQKKSFKKDVDFRFLFSQHPLCAMQLCHDLGVGVSLQRLQLWTKWLSVGFGILSFSTPFASLGLCPVDAFLCGSINVRNKCTGMGGCVRTQLVSWCAMVCFCCMCRAVGISLMRAARISSLQHTFETIV
jgi:hypothetical protein